MVNDVYLGNPLLTVLLRALPLFGGLLGFVSFRFVTIGSVRYLTNIYSATIKTNREFVSINWGLVLTNWDIKNAPSRIMLMASCFAELVSLMNIFFCFLYLTNRGG